MIYEIYLEEYQIEHLRKRRALPINLDVFAYSGKELRINIPKNCEPSYYWFRGQDNKSNPKLSIILASEGYPLKRVPGNLEDLSGDEVMFPMRLKSFLIEKIGKDRKNKFILKVKQEYPERKWAKLDMQQLEIEKMWKNS